ncbi:MAG: TetR/AcrR family transcriptional regulator [Cyanobacteria bacterium J06639_1]
MSLSVMPRPPKITNEEILEAARKVFLARGVRASTVEIAELAGISEASIFKRFATKQKLFMAAMGIPENPAWVEVLSGQEPSPDVRAELVEICVLILEFNREFMPRVLMLLAQGNLPQSQMPDFLPPPYRDRLLLAKYFKRAIAAGYMRSCDAETLSSIIVGTLMNQVMGSIMAQKLARGKATPPPDIDARALAEDLIETLWTGIAPET